MTPWVVLASQVSDMGPAICVLEVHEAPPSADVENPTSSWQVEVVQLAFG